MNNTNTAVAPFDYITGKRYLAHFNRDRKLSMTEIKEDAFIMSEDEIAGVIREPGSLIRTKTIIDIMSACASLLLSNVADLRIPFFETNARQRPFSLTMLAISSPKSISDCLTCNYTCNFRVISARKITKD